MKKVLLMVLLSFVAGYLTLFETAGNYNLPNNMNDNYMNKVTEVNKLKELNYNYYSEFDNNTRNYSYLYYFNSDNYIVRNSDDIKRSIYTGLNEGNDSISLSCAYKNSNNCIKDFYSIYKNKSLMSSINNYVNPYNEFSSTQYRININNDKVIITVEIDKKYTDLQIKEIDKELDIYFNELAIDEMNDESKIKWAHDFLVNKVEFDDNKIDDSYSAYGAIVHNSAVCQGYAEAMAIILDRFNIPNIMISSDTHIWNLVYVNGNWLHLDVTWDDSNDVLYDYYLISSLELSNLDSSSSHNFNSIYYLES